MLYNWEFLDRKEEDLIARGIREDTVLGGPFHLVLSPTNRCNFRCFFCNQDDKTQELEWPVLERILQDGVTMGVRGLTLLGGGEPLVYPNIADLWDFMESHSLRLCDITTNASRIDPDTAQRFHRLGLRCLTVSLNETTPDTHTASCGSSPELFQSAVAGIRHVIETGGDRRSDFEVRVQIFIWKRNFRQMGEMIDAVAALQPDRIYVNTMDGLPDHLRLTESERREWTPLLEESVRRWGALLQFRLIPEKMHRVAEELLARHAPEALILEDMCQTPGRVEYCYLGWYAPLVVATGDVFPCCSLAQDGRRSLGNIHRQSLDEIWRGEPMRRFRHEMRHLLLTGADRQLLPRRCEFIAPVCIERAACPMNFYLSTPGFYERMDQWADGGPRQAYTRRMRAKSRIRATLRRMKNLIRR